MIKFDVLKRKFEKIACQIIELCYEKDAENANYLITKRMPEFNNMNCIDIAYFSRDIDFMSQKYVKAILDKQWYDTIMVDKSKLKVKIEQTIEFFIYFGQLFKIYFLAKNKGNKGVTNEKIRSY